LHARAPARERLRKWAKRHPRLTSNLSLATATALVLALCLAGVFAMSARAARSEAAVTARLFDDDVRAARYLLSARAPDPATVDGGVAKCESALARYGLPGDPNWERRSEFRNLPGDEQRRVRAELTDACVLLARGHSLRAKDGAGEALKANELAERVSGGSPPRAVWEQRAELLRRVGKPEEAAKSAERAKAAPLEGARDYYLSGTEALSAGQHREALRLLRKAVDLDPADFAAHMSLGLCHEGLGQFSDAAACYTTAIALRPDHHGGYYARGLARLRLREPERARADLDKVVEMTPDAADVYLNRALAHQALRDFTAGLRDVEKAIELGAPRMRALCMRSRLKEFAGDAPGAKSDLAEALKLGASDDVSLVARGLARINTDLTGAISDFNDALEVNPRSLAAMQNKAYAQGKSGQNREAVKTLDGLLEVYPDYVPARSGRGVIHARLGNEKQAVADAEEAIKRDPSPAIAYQVAGIYALLDKARPGARAEAIRLLTAALRNGFGHEYLEADKDLDPIRDTPEFKRVLETVRTLRGDTSSR
jgi:tetratricopeptide (TPR) repeat protein